MKKNEDHITEHSKVMLEHENETKIHDALSTDKLTPNQKKAVEGNRLKYEKRHKQSMLEHARHEVVHQGIRNSLKEVDNLILDTKYII